MEVKLIVADGKNAGRAITVPGPKFLVGRAEDCQLRPRSDLVSRHHCAVLVEEGYVAIRDFGSKNGTLVNGEKVLAEQELKTGDRLTIGTLEFLVEVTVDVGGQKKPKVHSVEEAASRTVQSAQSSTSEEDGMDDWLGLDDDPDESAARTETLALRSSETETDAPKADAQSKPVENEEKNQRIDGPEEPKAKKKSKSSKDKDCGKVAANLLQSFFKRRR